MSMPLSDIQATISKKTASFMKQSLWNGWWGSFTFSPPCGENYGVDAVQPASSNRPVDNCHWSCEPHSLHNKKTDANASVFFMERVTRLELATSTLARWRSTGWATPATNMMYYSRLFQNVNTFFLLFKIYFSKWRGSFSLLHSKTHTPAKPVIVI